MLATAVQEHRAPQCPTPDELEIRVVEDLIQDQLKAYKNIHSLDKDWSKGVRESTFPLERTTAKMLEKCYKGWLDQAAPVLKRLQALETKGLRVGGSEAFRDTVGFCPAELDVDAIASAFERLERGEGIPLSKAIQPNVRARRTS